MEPGTGVRTRRMGMRGYGQHPQHNFKRGRDFWSMVETPTGDSQRMARWKWLPPAVLSLAGPANMGRANSYRRRAISTPLGATREDPAAYRVLPSPVDE